MKKTKSTLTARPYVDKRSIKTALDETFDYCDVANMSLLTAFLAGLKTDNRDNAISRLRTRRNSGRTF